MACYKKKKVAKWPPHGEKGPPSGEKSEKTPYIVKKISPFSRGGERLDNHGCSYMNDQLVIHYNDSHLSH